MSIASCIFTVLIALVLPVAAAIILSLKRKGYLKPILLGVLTFVLFQALLRIPLLQLVFAQMPWYIVMTAAQPMLAALFLGSTAALVENGGRYLIMKLFMKNRTRIGDGIAFGIGHGGIEAILLVGINVLIQLLTGGSADSLSTLLAGTERLCTIIVQIGFSVMVLNSVCRKKIGWLILAFVLHMVIDTAVAAQSSMGIPIAVIEAEIGVFALSMLVFIIYEWKQQVKIERTDRSAFQ